MFPELRQTYADALPDLSVPWAPDEAPEPRLVAVDREAAAAVGLDPDELGTPAGLAWLLGGPAADGEAPRTTAQAYAGHQFGQPNPQLGDGRAVLLGDLVAPDGSVRDLHLKGAGRTPFARGGDGKAPLGPMLRELVISEAMAALGIPTTLAVAVLGTGESVRRPYQPSGLPAGDPATDPRPYPSAGFVPDSGAILVRSAASHLRVGTFQYAAWNLGPDAVRALVEFAVDRHWPQAREDASGSTTLGLLRAVTHAQAELVAQWMLVGFVHGVMNTDNMTISGETIDYGPCAFLDDYRADAVFSSIDTAGRYAYRNQPGIALWNLSRFAEALIPALAEEPGIGSPDAAVDAVTAVLQEFEGAYLAAWARGMAAKLGVAVVPDAGVGDDEVRALAEDLLSAMEAGHADFTRVFRALADAPSQARELFDDPAAFDAWSERLGELRASAAAADGDAQAAALAGMAAANPVYIPRNGHLDAALRGASLGDMTALDRLREALRHPFDRREGFEDLETSGMDGTGLSSFTTYCGT